MAAGFISSVLIMFVPAFFNRFGTNDEIQETDELRYRKPE